jgi:hypothetical protein
VANFVYNTGKGKVARYCDLPATGDKIGLLVLATSGIEADAVLIDKATVAAVLSGTTNEVTNSGYARKGVTADIVVTIDTANDRTDVDITTDPTWTTVAAGDGFNDVVIYYDPDGSDTDATNVPMTQHDFVVVPDGSDITAQIATAGFFRAS